MIGKAHVGEIVKLVGYGMSDLFLVLSKYVYAGEYHYDVQNVKTYQQFQFVEDERVYSIAYSELFAKAFLDSIGFERGRTMETSSIEKTAKTKGSEALRQLEAFIQAVNEQEAQEKKSTSASSIISPYAKLRRDKFKALEYIDHVLDTYNMLKDDDPDANFNDMERCKKEFDETISYVKGLGLR